MSRHKNALSISASIAITLTLLASAAFSSPKAEELLRGRVVGVHDGDSITLLAAGNKQFKIRLESIDAPELGQEFGNNAKRGLSDLVHGREVSIQVTGLDKYERVLGWVWIERTLVNLAMVEKGLAWNYVEYSKSEELKNAELRARATKAGLWRGYNPMPPWEWRALQRSNAAAKRAEELMPLNSAPQPFSSTTKSKETPSASFWLNTSSNTRHNQGCRWYAKTKRGRMCTKSEGSACGICGG